MPPINDDFANAGNLGSATSGTVVGSNVDATIEAGEPHAGDYGDCSVWWRWTCPTALSSVMFTTHGSTNDDTAGVLDTVLAVFTGAAVDSLSEVAFDDDEPGALTSKVIFVPVAGTTYHVQVIGFGPTELGSITLHWEPGPEPPPIPTLSAVLSPVDTAVLSWTGTGTAITYHLQIKVDESDFFPYTNLVDIFTQHLGVSTASVYEFRVSASNAAGSSGWSNVVTVHPVEWACSPKTYYAQQTLVGPSPSGLHDASGSWASANGHGYNLVTGLSVSTIFGYVNDFSHSSIVRTHEGTHWFFVYGGVDTSDVPRSPENTGVRSLELYQVGPTGDGYAHATVPVMRDFGIYEGGEFFDGVSMEKVYSDLMFRGLDWSPFEDCLYLLLATANSHHLFVQESLGYPNALHTLLRVGFDGTVTTLWTAPADPFTLLEAGGRKNHLAVAADGAVWFSTIKVPVDGSYHLWRLALGARTPALVPVSETYPIADSFLGATSWGSMMTYYYPRDGAGHFDSAEFAYPLIVNRDGSVLTPNASPLIENGSRQAAGFMRTEDFQVLYAFMVPPAGLPGYMWKLDWAHCARVSPLTVGVSGPKDRLVVRGR